MRTGMGCELDTEEIDDCRAQIAVARERLAVSARKKAAKERGRGDPVFVKNLQGKAALKLRANLGTWADRQAARAVHYRCQKQKART